MNPQGFRDKRALTDLDSPPVGLLIEGEAQVEDQPSAAHRAPLSKHGAADGSGEIPRWPLHKQNRTPNPKGQQDPLCRGAGAAAKWSPRKDQIQGPSPHPRLEAKKICQQQPLNKTCEFRGTLLSAWYGCKEEITQQLDSQQAAVLVGDVASES